MNKQNPVCVDQYQVIDVYDDRKYTEPELIRRACMN